MTIRIYQKDKKDTLAILTVLLEVFINSIRELPLSISTSMLEIYN